MGAKVREVVGVNIRTGQVCLLQCLVCSCCYGDQAIYCMQCLVVYLDTVSYKFYLQMLYRCSHLTCNKYDNQSMFGRLDTLKVSLHRVMVREADELTGEELYVCISSLPGSLLTLHALYRWNFTVGEVELSVAEEEGRGEEDGVGKEEVGDPSCLSAPADWVVQVASSQGVLNAVRRWLLSIPL